MIEYKMTLKEEQKIQPLVAFIYDFYKMLIGIACAIASIVFIVIALTSNAKLIGYGVLFLFPTLYFVYFFTNRVRRRSLAMANLYRSHQAKIFTFTLSETDGVIHDFCNETRTASDKKRAHIRHIIKTRDYIVVVFLSGDISVFPNKKEISEFFRK